MATSREGCPRRDQDALEQQGATRATGDGPPGRRPDGTRLNTAELAHVCAHDVGGRPRRGPPEACC